jgi:hypothetical protein
MPLTASLLATWSCCGNDGSEDESYKWNFSLSLLSLIRFFFVVTLIHLMKKLYLFFFLIFYFLLPLLGTTNVLSVVRAKKRHIYKFIYRKEFVLFFLCFKGETNCTSPFFPCFFSSLFSFSTLKEEVNKGDILYDDDDNDVII